ncbi:MAG: penicillin-binding protein activator [Phycisphaeraceae bacterium]|nr:penicillin-binding protein activator [Phycisphaeraceae bacterium]
MLLPQTGGFAAVGRQMQRGYALAELVLAERGLRDVEIRYFDTTSSPSGLEQVMTGVASWKPDMLVGPYGSEEALAVAEKAEAMKLPLIVPSATIDLLTQNQDGVVFRLAPTQSMIADTAASFLLSQKESLKFTETLVLAEEDEFGKQGVASLQAAFKHKGLTEPRVSFYQPGNVKDVLTNLVVPAGAVVVVMTRSSEDAIQIVDKVGRAGKVLGLYAGVSSTDFRMMAAARPAGSLPAVYTVTPWPDDANQPQTAQFVQRFVNKYRDALDRGIPQYHSVQAYSALLVAGEAIRHARSNKTSLFSALKTLRMDSPLGEIHFMNFSGHYGQYPAGAVVQSFSPMPPHTVFPAVEKPKAAAPEPRGVLRTVLENQIVALFAILALGLLLGNIEIKGIGLGGSGVLFVALLFGHFKFTVPGVVGTLGLVLFVYGVGAGAGPGFFRAFVKQGATLAKVGALLVAIGAATTYCCAKLFHVPTDLAVGIFSGAMTSTPALAAAMDQLKESGPLVSIGYGVAYPFGVGGVVLFVQLLPKLLGVNLDKLDAEVTASRSKKKAILRVVAEVTNPAVIGRHLLEVEFIQRSGCQVVRVMEGQRMIPLSPDLVLEQGERLLLVGTEDNLKSVVEYLGRRSDEPFFMDAENERKQIVVTAPAIVGRSLRGLDLMRTSGLTVSRIVRHDVGFVPHADTIIERFDMLTCVGEPANLDKFALEAGHRAKALDETDLASLAIGIVAGVLLGLMPLGFGAGNTFTLGMAGGPLFVALILGHFGRIGGVTGHIPRAARLYLTELGLVLFLASAGVTAGSRFVEVVREHGMVLFFVGVLVTLIPMIVGYVSCRWWFKLNLLEILGGTCGGMTSTPGLGAVTAKTDSDVPVISYATAYPVALILMTIFVQILIPLLRG